MFYVEKASTNLIMGNVNVISLYWNKGNSCPEVYHFNMLMIRLDIGLK